MKPKPFHPWSYQYNKAYERGRKNKWDYLRFWAKDHNLSLQAQLKLEWIIFYHTAGKHFINGWVGLMKLILKLWRNIPDLLTEKELGW